jgi:peptidoglycan hydrolase CwlO-like protein
MEGLTIALALSIISTVIAISNFVLSRKDKAVKDSKENHQELIEYQLNELKQDVKSIIAKLDKYDKEFDDRIEKAMELHIQYYHKGD